MFRERILLFPKAVDQMLVGLYEKHRKTGFGSFASYDEFLRYLIDLGAKKDEHDMDKFVAPSIVIPSLSERPKRTLR